MSRLLRLSKERPLLCELVAWAVAAGLAAAIMPQVLAPYPLHVVDVVLINVIIVVGLNFILGFGGQISLCQAAFFGVGAYGYSTLVLRHVPVPVAVLAGVLLSALVGLAIGWPTLKLKGHYLALATLGFGIIVQELMVNLDGITGGANGLNNMPAFGLGPLQFDSDFSFFYLLLFVAALAVVTSVLFNHSPIGMRARAMRDDETAAGVAGVNVSGIKILLFVTSATYAGVAGVLYSGFLSYISPDVFGWDTTFNYLVMAVIGGLGSTVGAVVGAVLLTELPENLRFLKEAYLAVFGVLVIVLMAAAPGGLIGLLRTALTRLLRRPLPGGTAAATEPDEPRVPAPQAADKS